MAEAGSKTPLVQHCTWPCGDILWYVQVHTRMPFSGLACTPFRTIWVSKLMHASHFECCLLHVAVHCSTLLSCADLACKDSVQTENLLIITELFLT